MKPHDPHKLRHEQKQQAEQELAHQQETQTTREFATPEELLRFDAARVQTPPGLAGRLKESLEREPKKPRSWWRKFFS